MWFRFFSLIAFALLSVVGCGGEFVGAPQSQEQLLNLDLPEQSVATQSLEIVSLPSRITVRGVGAVEFEAKYIPGVIACEIGSPGKEALKAQAVAARTYAAYKLRTVGSLGDGQSDQVFSCGRQPSSEHIAAATETAGQVLAINGAAICSFYVAGAIPTRGDCDGRGSGRGPFADTESYVTYNGKAGEAFRPSSIGSAVPENQGCMSQNGAMCLAGLGKTYDQILSFYYGTRAKLDPAIPRKNAQAAPTTNRPVGREISFAQDSGDLYNNIPGETSLENGSSFDSGCTLDPQAAGSSLILLVAFIPFLRRRKKA